MKPLGCPKDFFFLFYVAIHDPLSPEGGVSRRSYRCALDTIRPPPQEPRRGCFFFDASPRGRCFVFCIALYIFFVDLGSADGHPSDKVGVHGGEYTAMLQALPDVFTGSIVPRGTCQVSGRESGE